VQLFTEPHEDYHRPTDTADKVDTGGLVKVAAFTREALVYLAGRTEPLTATIAGGGPSAAGAKGGTGAKGTGGGEGPPAARRVTLGTVPDFGFAGPGVKVSDVAAGSPAEAAGVRKGDILLRLDGEAIASLKGYSDLLRTKSPGQTVAVTVLREGQETVLSVTLAAR
jgi:S1-C subfamily serine protease